VRRSGHATVSLIAAYSELDARLWLHGWARKHGRAVITVPFPDPAAALAAYRARFPDFGRTAQKNSVAPPLLYLPGEIETALAAARALLAEHPHLPLCVTAEVASLVARLVKASLPDDLAALALQGLVTIDARDRAILGDIAEKQGGKVFVRGACEGVVYFLLAAQPETRDAGFVLNGRLPKSTGKGSYEVDLLCRGAMLAIEIDGPEHDQGEKQRSDAAKQADLESQGYRVYRFTNITVLTDPLGVWRQIAGWLAATNASLGD